MQKEYLAQKVFNDWSLIRLEGGALLPVFDFLCEMPLLDSRYKAPAYLRNGHLATIIPSIFRKVELKSYTRERIHTPDGDFLDIDWLNGGNDKLLIISHGLEGSSDRPYIKGMAKYGIENGWDSLAWNCRSCSGEPNWKPRFYHHGATEDLELVINHALSAGYTKVGLVGFSMGGNMTLKYLGEHAYRLNRAIVGGVAYSVPVSLKSSVEALSTLGSHFYRKRFLKKLEEKIRQKSELFPEEVEYSTFGHIKYFPDFDNIYTAPLHGFKNAEDFYERASARRYMYEIRRPTLLVNALNDPFLGKECYPFEKCESHGFIYLETPKHGGHVGFSLKDDKYNYMEKRALEFFEEWM